MLPKSQVKIINDLLSIRNIADNKACFLMEMRKKRKAMPGNTIVTGQKSG
jgi:hypothetical protein